MGDRLQGPEDNQRNLMSGYMIQVIHKTSTLLPVEDPACCFNWEN